MTIVKKRKPAKSKTRKTTTKKRKTTTKYKVAKKPIKRRTKRTTAIDGVKAKKTGIKKVIKTLKSTLAELEKKVG
jgi:translation initiation factor 1 (eIF-1/SUI1)